MLRISIIIALIVSMFLTLRGVEGNFRENILPETAKQEEKQTAVIYESDKLDYYPPDPDVMPDLLDGYIFNQERLLEEEIEEEVPEEDVTPQAAAIEDFEQVQYSGSVIMESQRLALIKFPEAPPPEEKENDLKRRRPGHRRLPVKSARSQKSSGGLKNIRVKQGEMFKGFLVAEIAPEMIVFERGEEKIVKYLYDKNKERTVAKPSPSRNEEKPIAKLVPPGTPAVPGVPPTAPPQSAQQAGAAKPQASLVKPNAAVPQRPARRFNVPSRGRRGLFRALEKNPGLMAPPE